MSPERADVVKAAVEWLLTQAGADVVLTIADAQLAKGATVAITVRAYVPTDAEPWRHIGELL